MRVVDGRLETHGKLRFMQTGKVHEADEVGVRSPDNVPVDGLGRG